jgi:hypothetical protein
MKIFGVILILVGIGVFIYRGIQSTEKEKVLDVGPVEITKEVTRSGNDWQLYVAGGVAVLAGIILVLADRKRANA